MQFTPLSTHRAPRKNIKKRVQSFSDTVYYLQAKPSLCWFTLLFFISWHKNPQWPLHYWSFTITLWQTTIGRSPLENPSARWRDLYLTTHNTHHRHTSVPMAWFEPAIPGSERPQSDALVIAVTEISINSLQSIKCKYKNERYFRHESDSKFRYTKSSWTTQDRQRLVINLPT